jgi:hypothetical protein
MSNFYRKDLKEEINLLKDKILYSTIDSKRVCQQGVNRISRPHVFILDVYTIRNMIKHLKL